MIQIHINDTDVGLQHSPNIQEPCSVLDLLLRLGKLPGSQYLVRLHRHNMATWAGPSQRLIDQDRLVLVPIAVQNYNREPVDARAIVVPIARTPFGPDCGPREMCRNCKKCYESYVEAKMAGAT